MYFLFNKFSLRHTLPHLLTRSRELQKISLPLRNFKERYIHRFSGYVYMMYFAWSCCWCCLICGRFELYIYFCSSPCQITHWYSYFLSFYFISNLHCACACILHVLLFTFWGGSVVKWLEHQTWNPEVAGPALTTKWSCFTIDLSSAPQLHL